MYRALATYYDRLMADVPYGDWVDFAVRFLPEGSGVDLACGTGSFTLALAQRGRRVTGVDSSADMLRVACEKALTRGLRTTFVQSDMTAFSCLPVDFVTCVCDGINYIEQPADVFARVYEMLVPGGVFLFDVSSAYKLRNTLGNHTFFYDDGDLVYMWRNFPHKTYLDIDLTFFAREGDLWRRSDESQRQFLHSELALTEALYAAGFTVQTFGGYAMRPVGKNEERICFVCRRAG